MQLVSSLALTLAAAGLTSAAAITKRAVDLHTLTVSPEASTITCIDSGMILDRDTFHTAVESTCGDFAGPEPVLYEPHAFMEKYEAEDGDIVVGCKYSVLHGERERGLIDDHTVMVENTSPETLEMTEKLCRHLADKVYEMCTVEGEGTRGGYIEGAGWKVMFDPVEMEADEE